MAASGSGAVGLPILDIGPLDGPVLLFGGPYGNLEAAASMRDEARRRNIPPRNVICTGDVVAYCADPAATVALIRDWGIHVVMGNVEEQLGAGAGDCGCGFTEGSVCDRLSAQWYALADAAISPEDRIWMARLPRVVTFSAGGRRLAAVHGMPDEINRFVFASTDAGLKADACRRLGVDGIVGGHSGLPFTQIVDGFLWHNPGALGMPANDATPRVWFSILEPAGQRGAASPAIVRHEALDYDHAAAAAKMRRAGLAGVYADSLESGLWPKVDFLPSAEQSAAGEPLAPATTLWAGPRTALRHTG